MLSHLGVALMAFGVVASKTHRMDLQVDVS